MNEPARAAGARAGGTDQVGAPDPYDTDALEPYEALARHAELGLELAGRGDIAALRELGKRWGELTAALPAVPPAAAAPVIERARLLNERSRIELLRLRELLLGELSTLRRARRAADGYRAGLGPRQRLERSA